MKKIKLGTKIVMRFFLLIFITMALGGIAVWQMKSVADDSVNLAKEFVPEVKVAALVKSDQRNASSAAGNLTILSERDPEGKEVKLEEVIPLDEKGTFTDF